jgi:phenylalanyl-tRNA synthetase beta subunit
MPKLSGKSGKPNSDLKVPITVKCPHEVKRFTTRIFQGVKVGESPRWLRERLEAYGIGSINNIVDITNYVMVELGQPLHAQDIDKLPQLELTWRLARAGEKLTTFLGTELALDPSMFVMTSGDVPLVLGGIIGGEATGVRDTTTSFVLDAGNYDQRSVRHTSRKLHISNETVLRSDKFLDPRATEVALARATELILELAGGTYYEGSDYYPEPIFPNSMTLRLSRLHALSGMDFTAAHAKKILTALDYVVVEQSEDSLTVEIPYFRTDVEVEDDLVADILRISNYNNIPSSPLTTPVPEDITPQIYRFEDRLRDILVALGAHEHITTSLVPKSNDDSRVVLENALSSEAGALRLNIDETLAPIVTTYRKHGLNDFVIFELGLTFSRSSLDNTYDSLHETRSLTVMADHDVRPTLASLMHELGITYDLTMYDNSVTIYANKQQIGTLSLNSFSLDTQALLSLAKEYGGVISEFTHNTSIDISITTKDKTPFSEIKALIVSASKSLLAVEVLEVKEPNLLLRLTWDEQADYLKEKQQILEALNQKLGITSRSK